MEQIKGRLGVYAVRDIAAGFFMRPFYSENDAVAQRSVEQALHSDSNSTMAKYPDQFELFRVGNFNEFTGIINGEEKSALGLLSRFFKN